MCGADDCPRCYPGCNEKDEDEEQDCEPDEPPEPSKSELDYYADKAEGAYTKRILG